MDGIVTSWRRRHRNHWVYKTFVIVTQVNNICFISPSNSSLPVFSVDVPHRHHGIDPERSSSSYTVDKPRVSDGFASLRYGNSCSGFILEVLLISVDHSSKTGVDICDSS